ncbi:MAG TPA: RNA polymerase sigma factor [Bacteroidales bacterium]|nr:RNA polymerase sigma factor [Bacteroidales bacterium]
MTRKEFESDILPFSTQLYRFAFRFLKNREEAEDAIQEVFLKLWKMRDKLSEYNNLKAFAMTVTRNHCLDMLRKKRTDYLDDTGTEDTRTNGMITEDVLEKKEKYNIVTEIIISLPESYRTIIWMHDVDGYNYTEIAEKMGTDVKNLRVKLSRARKMVREELKKKNYELVSA